jgi:hypothetical protein
MPADRMKSYTPDGYVCRLSCMSPDHDVLVRLRSLGPVFRAGQAIDAGVSWRDLYRVRDEGLVVELSRGFYQLAGEGAVDQPDFVAVCARAPQAMVCLRSALAYWDLSDEIPGWVDLAVPRGSHRPQIDHPPVQVHVFGAGTFGLGRMEITAGPGARFAITGAERTVVDVFRFRRRLGEDLAFGGLRRYLQRPRPKPGQLAELAGELRVRGPVLDALRVLQS